MGKKTWQVSLCLGFSVTVFYTTSRRYLGHWACLRANCSDTSVLQDTWKQRGVAAPNRCLQDKCQGTLIPKILTEASRQSCEKAQLLTEPGTHKLSWGQQERGWWGSSWGWPWAPQGGAGPGGPGRAPGPCPTPTDCTALCRPCHSCTAFCFIYLWSRNTNPHLPSWLIFAKGLEVFWRKEV